MSAVLRFFLRTRKQAWSVADTPYPKKTRPLPRLAGGPASALIGHADRSGFADIVGFGNTGVWTALSDSDDTFREPNHNPVLENFGYTEELRRPALLWRSTSVRL